jgi:hypothetical protein
MSKRPMPEDEAEIVRQMELLEGVAPSDVTLPEQGDLTDQDQAMLERHRAMEQMLDDAYKDKVPVEEMLERARERHRETQRIAQESLSPLTETGLSDLVPTLDTLRNLPETSGNLLSNMFDGLGAVGTAFKGLGKGLFGAATGKPMENEKPTIFDTSRFTSEEIEDQFKKIEAMDTSEVQAPTAQKTDRSEKVARLAEDAVKKTGKEIFSAADAPELFAATSFSSDNDGTRKIIELLETLPSRISEELKA